MSGHSKWSTIKRKKGVVDERRGALFAKLSKELIVAARLHGDDPNTNQRLRAAIGRSKECNMPKNKMQQAIDKGSGKGNNSDAPAYEELLFEFFLSKGVALLIVAQTDKRSRTTPEIKNILKKYEAQLAAAQTVQRLFQQVTQFIIKKETTENREEELLEILTDFSNDLLGDWNDLSESEREILYTGMTSSHLREQLETSHFEVLEESKSCVPHAGTRVQLSAKDDSVWKNLNHLLEDLLEHSEVVAVFHNASHTPATANTTANTTAAAPKK